MAGLRDKTGARQGSGGWAAQGVRVVFVVVGGFMFLWVGTSVAGTIGMCCTNTAVDSISKCLCVMQGSGRFWGVFMS